jgi:hypothetical protein
MGHTGGRQQQSLDLIDENLREGPDDRRPISQEASQKLRHGDHPLSHGHLDVQIGQRQVRNQTGRRYNPMVRTEYCSPKPSQSVHTLVRFDRDPPHGKGPQAFAPEI